MSLLMRRSKTIIAVLAFVMLAGTVHASWKFNPYTGKLDYYEADGQNVSTTATPTFAGVVSTGTVTAGGMSLSAPLPVASGGTGNTINAGRLYLYQHTASSIYSASTSTGLAWTSCPLCEVVLFSGTIPGGSLGPNGIIRITELLTHTNSSNGKTPRVKLGSMAFFSVTYTSGQTTIQAQTIIRNRNAENSQVGNAVGNPGFSTGSTGGVVTGSIDTATSQPITITGQTSLETGFATTSVVGAGGTCTATKASHGLNSGEYAQASGGGTCPTSGNPNGDPVAITVSDVNTFTYSCSCVGTEAGTQPTIKRYSVIQLESADVELLKP